MMVLVTVSKNVSQRKEYSLSGEVTSLTLSVISPHKPSTLLSKRRSERSSKEE